MALKPRTRKRTVVRDAAEFGFVLAAEWVFSCIGLKASLALARHLGRLGHRLVARYPKVSRENLRHAYPDWSAERIERLSVRVAEHLAEGVVEGLMLPRLLTSRAQLESRFDPRHVHPKALAAIRSRPCIFVTGHFGNWELASLIAAYYGFPLASVMRPIDNRFLHWRIVSWRERLKQGLIDKRGALLGMTRSLREGVSIATLIDQDAKREGIFVDFFGRPASTVDGVAAIALRLGTPVIVGYLLRRSEPGRYDMHLEEPLTAERTGNDAEDRRRLTQLMTRRLEDAIRRHPDQWVWFHRRWKTRPVPDIVLRR